MTRFFAKFLRDAGVNRAVGYGVLTRLWSALVGPVTILVIATRFSKAQQGYYYTFSSLLALQVFFELGLLTVLAQFAAHEFAFLSWGANGSITGSEEHRDRFVDLLGKGVKWYAISGFVLVLTLIPSGLWFFSQRSADITNFDWKIPWTLAVIGVGCNLLLIPFYAVITGSGDVASINRREMLGGVAGTLICWLTIFCDGGLYAVPAVTTGNLIVGAVYLCRSKLELLRSAWQYVVRSRRPLHQLSWWREVWPMQWKIALSWVSGYFIFQLFTPVLFKYHGPVVAGQMGMTLSAANGLVSISMVWMQAKTPELGKLIAVRDWAGLNALFKKTFMQTMFIAMLGAIGIVTLIFVFQQTLPIGQRFLPAYIVVILMATTLINISVFCLAAYMRAHKVEPMLLNSLVAASLLGISTVALGKNYGSIGVISGYFTVALLLLPYSIHIFNKFKINCQK